VNEPDTTARQVPAARILWAALLASIVVYALVANNFRPEAPAEAADLGVITAVIAATAAGTLVASAIVPRLLARQGAPYITFCILRWALAESVAVFGLVLTFMGALPRVGHAFFAVSALAILLQPPGGRDLERFRELRGR